MEICSRASLVMAESRTQHPTGNILTVVYWGLIWDVIAIALPF
ncbi:hypothetical protein [Halothece sp. PCC 7418]|nr:hypothetical protein [Halothece sp. PCC 7418]